MKWSDEYATGIKRIDNQHKTLFNMAEDFRLALDEGGGSRFYGMLLESLDRYARSHFGYEEQCMEEYHCPVAQKNKDAHEHFLEILTTYKQQYTESGFDVTEAYKLLDIMEKWLVNHICHTDLQLKDYAVKDE